MLARSSIRYLVLVYISDILATVSSLVLATLLRQIIPLGKTPTEFGQPTWPIYVMVIVIWSVSFWLLNAYDPKAILNCVDEGQRVILAATAAQLVLAGMLFFTYRGLSRLLLGYFYLLDILLVLLLRSLIRVLVKSMAPNGMARHRVLIVGAGVVGQDLARKLDQRGWLGLEVVGYLDDDEQKLGQGLRGFPVLGPLRQAPEVIGQHKISEVVIALPLWAYGVTRDLVSRLQDLPVNIKVVPDFFALTLFSASMEDLDGIPLIGLKEPVIEGSTRVAKRVMDVIIGTLALLAVSPLMLVVAVLIKLDSRGPVLFKQVRVGENGKLFRMYKFRTMVVGAEDQQAEMLVQREGGKMVFNKSPDDPRMTPLGKRLRRLSLDEWPQLVNVLRGEMSLVGPRPELPFLVDMYEPWQRRRFSVPQGMTGWWQINDRSDKPMHLHTEDDLYYIQNYSLGLDIRILWRTVGAVLRKHGAY